MKYVNKVDTNEINTKNIHIFLNLGIFESRVHIRFGMFISIRYLFIRNGFFILFFFLFFKLCIIIIMKNMIDRYLIE